MISAAMAFLSVIFSFSAVPAITLRSFLDRFSLFVTTCCHSSTGAQGEVANGLKVGDQTEEREWVVTK